MKKLSIVILNFNTKNLTLRAIDSCLSLQKSINVFVVDNNSSDGSVEAFKKMQKQHKNLHVIALPKNIGFSAGNNVVLRIATSQYLMLLNSDAYIPEDQDLEDALAYLDKHQDVAILSPYVELEGGGIDPACHRGFPTPWNAVTYFSGLEKKTKSLTGLNRLFGGYHQTWKDMHTIHDIDACTGAAMIVRKSAMDTVGLLDEQFFMYGEDLDWCYRFRQAGHRIVFFPSVKVIHDKHTSGIKKVEKDAHTDFNVRVKKKTNDAFYDAMKLFYKKHNVGLPIFERLVLVGIHTLKAWRN